MKGFPFSDDSALPQSVAAGEWARAEDALFRREDGSLDYGKGVVIPFISDETFAAEVELLARALSGSLDGLFAPRMCVDDLE